MFSKRASATCKLCLESLETRDLPSSLFETVTSAVTAAVSAVQTTIQTEFVQNIRQGIQAFAQPILQKFQNAIVGVENNPLGRGLTDAAFFTVGGIVLVSGLTSGGTIGSPIAGAEVIIGGALMAEGLQDFLFHTVPLIIHQQSNASPSLSPPETSMASPETPVPSPVPLQPVTFPLLPQLVFTYEFDGDEPYPGGPDLDGDSDLVPVSFS